MTKKEIIKKGNEKFPQDIIEIINDDGSITREDVNFKIRKAYMEGLIDNNISLPSNLDEAAKKYGHEEPILPEGYNDKVANGNYTEDDLKLLMQYLNPANRVTEVESVEITDADDITQEEADKIIEQLLKEREK